MVARVEPGTAPREAPGDSFLLGSLLAMRKDLLGFLESRAAQQGDVARFRLGPRACFLVTGADGVRAVLQERHASFRKNPHYVSTMSVALGEGLITSEGELHLRQRRLAQPAFHQRYLDGFARDMTQVASETSAAWEQKAARGEPIDVGAEMSRLALAIIMKTFFNDEFTDGAAARVVAGMGEMNRQLNEDIFAIARVPKWLPTPRNLRFRRSLTSVDQTVNELIRTRRAEGGEPHGLLGLLMCARDAETGEPMSDRLIRDEVVTLIAAGHETAANALVWTWDLLARHREVASRLRDELHGVLHGAEPDHSMLERLPYLRQVVDESLRLRPPVYLFDRIATRDVEIDGASIPSGSIVYLSPWVTHRSPAYWSAPDRFDPEHFSPDSVARRPRFAYFPFGVGPRQCIGSAFAVLEIQLVLATLAQRWALDLLSADPLEPEPCITLRPPERVFMRLRER